MVKTIHRLLVYLGAYGLCCVFVGPAFAAQYDAWINKVKGNYDPLRITFVEDLKSSGIPKFLKLRDQSVGFLEILRDRDAWLKYMINAEHPDDDDEGDVADRLRSVQSKLNVNAVVLASRGKTWQIVTAKGKKIEKIIDKEAPGESGGAIAQWVTQALGYEGIIIDLKDDLILVATLPGKLQGNSQGVVLKKSQKKFVFPREPSAGAALIELVEAHGDFGVFRVLLQSDPESIKIGSKVLLERGEE